MLKSASVAEVLSWKSLADRLAVGAEDPGADGDAVGIEGCLLPEEEAALPGDEEPAVRQARDHGAALVAGIGVADEKGATARIAMAVQEPGADLVPRRPDRQEAAVRQARQRGVGARAGNDGTLVAASRAVGVVDARPEIDRVRAIEAARLPLHDEAAVLQGVDLCPGRLLLVLVDREVPTKRRPVCPEDPGADHFAVVPVLVRRQGFAGVPEGDVAASGQLDDGRVVLVAGGGRVQGEGGADAADGHGRLRRSGPARRRSGGRAGGREVFGGDTAAGAGYRHISLLSQYPDHSTEGVVKQDSTW